MRCRRLGFSYGFTLVEVLAVIGIVCVVAAISYAVVANSKRSAKLAACASNLRQIGTGLELYTADHDGYWPPFGFWRSTKKSGEIIEENQVAFINALGHYRVPNKMFFCPADSHAGTDFPGEFYSFRNTSYCLGLLVQATATASSDHGMQFHPATVLDPSSFVAFEDQVIKDPRNQSGRWTSHGGLSNTLYIDGHVTAEKLSQNPAE